MFRFTTEVKGLAIDFDSFEEPIESWDEIANDFNCLFITTVPESKENIENTLYAKTLLIERTPRNFIPNPEIQTKVLQSLNIQESELAYVSADSVFTSNALTFYSAVIYVTHETMNYEEYPQFPDLICPNLYAVRKSLKQRIVSFFGEEYFSREANSLKGAVVPNVEVHYEKGIGKLICLGRYYGHKTYMQQLHPYSRIISMNKNQEGKLFRLYDAELADLLSKAVYVYLKDSSDCVCSVPVRKGTVNRFENIVEKIAQKNGLENISHQFVAKRDYGKQKLLSHAERKQNVKDAFSFDGSLEGKRVILLDDIITTGETLRECALTLRNAGADKISFLTFAINQKEIEYGTANQPKVCCPKCGMPMKLFANSKNRFLFYSCRECGVSSGYEKEKAKLLTWINQEFTKVSEMDNEENFDITL